MVGLLQLEYHINAQTYGKLYAEYGLSKKDNVKKFSDNPITEASFLDLVYGKFGHIYFLWITVDVNLLHEIEGGGNQNALDAAEFHRLLAQAYAKTFGQSAADAICAAEKNRCSYIEYMAFVKVENADALMKKLETGRFAKEQLDIACFDSYKLKNAYVTFTINQIDDVTVRLCAKCPNTALKRICKIDGLSHVTTTQALNKDIAAITLYKQVLKHTKPDVPPELSEEIIRACI